MRVARRNDSGTRSCAERLSYKVPDGVSAIALAAKTKRCAEVQTTSRSAQRRLTRKDRRFMQGSLCAGVQPLRPWDLSCSGQLCGKARIKTAEIWQTPLVRSAANDA